MQIARIVRSGETLSIELPPGFDVGTGEMEIRREGESIHLQPIPAQPVADAEWAWLDDLEPVSQDFIDAIERIEAEDIAAGKLLLALSEGA